MLYHLNFLNDILTYSLGDTIYAIATILNSNYKIIYFHFPLKLERILFAIPLHFSSLYSYCTHAEHVPLEIMSH
jgi:hypothetical protein